MLLILEIGSTVAAWRKGWRWRALHPVGGFAASAFLVGMAEGMAGGNVQGVTPLLFLLELLGIGVLVWMSVSAPQRLRLRESPEPNAPPEPATETRLA
jgi:threonine/homoserine/homoserine lactone efflux protein